MTDLKKPDEKRPAANTPPATPRGKPLIEDEAKLEALASDFSDGGTAAGAILRENARLNLANGRLRKHLRNEMIYCMSVALFAFLFCWGMFYYYPKLRYVVTGDAAATCEINGMTKPPVSETDVTEYAADAVLALNSYDYLNYRERIDEAVQRWLDPAGRKSYMDALATSRNVERVKEYRFIMRATKTNVPQLESVTHLGNDGTQWSVQVPILIEYYANGSAMPAGHETFLAIVTMATVDPSPENKKGIAVHNIIMRPVTPRATS